MPTLFFRAALLSAMVLFLVLGAGGQAVWAKATASPDSINIIITSASISKENINFVPIFENAASAVTLDQMARRLIGRNTDIPSGTYRVLELAVGAVTWSVTWTSQNPSPCAGDTSPGAAGSFDLGADLIYFKTADLGGNTLAFYRANPPLSGYIGDSAHPFLLASPIVVQANRTTSVDLVIGTSGMLSCESVGKFPKTADGNLSPTEVIFGAATRTDGIGDIVLDPDNQEIILANTDSNRVSYFALGDQGDMPPSRNLIGPATRLNQPAGIGLYKDPSDTINKNEIYVANRGNDSITVFNRKNERNIIPIRTIGGLHTGLSRPAGIFVDSARNVIHVANEGNGSVSIYSRLKSGDALPDGVLSGLIGPSGVHVGNMIHFTGTATAGGADTLSDTAQNFPGSQLLGLSITITGGTGIGQSRVISGHTIDTVTVSPNWAAIPDATSAYQISGDALFISDPPAGAVVVANRSAVGAVIPIRRIVGAGSGLIRPVRLWVDRLNDELIVADEGSVPGQGSVRVFAGSDIRTATNLTTGIADPAPARVITGSNTGIGRPTGLYLDEANGRIGVAGESLGPQVVAAGIPSFYPAVRQTDVPSTPLNGVYNIIAYGTDLIGINHKGRTVPTVVSGRGTATFDPGTTEPSFVMRLSNQVARRVIETACQVIDPLNVDRNGFYGVDSKGRFYLFIDGIRGKFEGGFLPDGTSFVASLFDGPDRMMVIYGVKSTGADTPRLSSSGEAIGLQARYAFSTYYNDLFTVGRPTDNDALRYLIGIGAAVADSNFFLGSGSDANLITVLNPLGLVAEPLSASAAYRAGFLNDSTHQYTPHPGGQIEINTLGFLGALKAKGGTWLFMRNGNIKPGDPCDTTRGPDIGFGLALRQHPGGAFSTGSIRGTYLAAVFGDRYVLADSSNRYRTGLIRMAFNGSGRVDMEWVESEMGSVVTDRAVFNYRVRAKQVPETGNGQAPLDVVDIFARIDSDPYASAFIGQDGKTLIFHRSLNPGGVGNLTRQLGLAVYQHP